MLLEIAGICQHCAEDVKVLMHNGEPQDDCPKCGEAPFVPRRIKGLVYVISNPNQTGVKVGLTTKSVQERIKSLNSTGVAGSFLPVAIFPSDRPTADERKVHEKLRRHLIAKEHFDLEPVEAVLGAYRALNKRRPIFFDEHVEQTFALRLEQARIAMQLRLRGEKA